MIALITGATSGIGKATAQLLAQKGYNLILTGRRNQLLQPIAEALRSTHQVQVETLCFDVRNNGEVVQAMASLPASRTMIDVLVNNAGLAAGLSKIQDGLLEDWEDMIDTNVKGLLYMSKIVMKYMIQRQSGHIINIGSIAGKQVYPNGNVYCGTKHAVDAISNSMRIDLLEHGIKVTAIHPGMVETEFSLVRFKGDAQKAKQVYHGLQPLSGDDIANTIFWAISQPDHVNINEITITPKAQANAYISVRQQ